MLRFDHPLENLNNLDSLIVSSIEVITNARIAPCFQLPRFE